MAERDSRVLHVAAVDFTVAKLLAPQLRALRSHGFEARVTAGRTDDELWRDLRDLEPLDLAFPRRPAPGAVAHAVLKLQKEVVRWQPRILHLHTPAASFPVRMLPRAFWPRGLKVFYTVHGYPHPWPPSTMGQKSTQRLEAALSNRTDVSLFQSAEDLRQAGSHGYGGELLYLGNGVEDVWFEVPPPRRSGPLRLVFIGRLVAEKGILDLLDALLCVDGVHLDVVGDSLTTDRDSVSHRVATRVQELGLSSRVHLHGMLERAAVRGVVANAHGLVLPSYREGVPRSLIEGMSAGRPGLASDIRGCRELIHHGVNGFLFPAGDVARMADAMRHLRDMTDDLFMAMSHAARETMDECYRESKVVERLVSAYKAWGLRPR